MSIRKFWGALRNTQEDAKYGSWLHAPSPIFFAILIVAFVLAVTAGLFRLSIYIASLGAIIAVVFVFWVCFWSWFSRQMRRATNKDSESDDPGWKDNGRLRSWGTRVGTILAVVPYVFWAISLGLLAYWADSASPLLGDTSAHVAVSTIQKFGTQVDLLAQQVERLATERHEQNAGLQGSIDGLGRQVENLAGKVGGLPGQQPPIPPEPISIKPQELEGHLSLDFPPWTIILASIFLPLLVLLVFCGAWLGATPEARRKVVMFAIPAVALASTPTVLSLAGKLNIKSLFTCEKGCLQFTLGSSATALLPLSGSPSFDVGSANTSERTVGCVDPSNSKDEWESWLTEFRDRWVNRHHATESDALLIVGSADRQRLSEPFHRRFGSNVGLARARAETVKKLLIEKTNIEELPVRDRLNEGRIIVLTTGPANTPDADQSSNRSTFPCNDQALADDRRVRLWMHAATAK